jgi:hypothetical protein
VRLHARVEAILSGPTITSFERALPSRIVTKAPLPAQKPFVLEPIVLLGLLALPLLAGCGRHATAVAPAPSSTKQAGAAPVVAGCLPTHNGYLRGRLRGAENLDIDWRDAELQCDGGPRPEQRGIRLTFAGPELPGGHHLRFVFGIADAPPSGHARDLPANVTILFEGEPRLYSTRGEDKCTIDELIAAQIPASSPKRLRVSARGFCVGPAAAVGGGTGLLLSRFDFAGSVLYEGDSHDPAPPP